jgi:acyl carrier protein
MSLSDARIIDEIAEIARTHIDWTGELRRDMRLVEDLELDSLKSLTLALEVENHFRVCLDEEAVILTVGDLVEMIRERLDD